MRKQQHSLAILIGILCFLSACSGSESKKVARGFYYWKSGSISIFEEHIFQEAEATKLYLKIFEISMDDLKGAIPVSKAHLQLPPKFVKNVEIVPCIFVENEVIAKSTKEQLEELAKNTVALTNKFLDDKLKQDKGAVITCTEIQIDCDWMASSKSKYFEFLEAVKKQTDKKISCTLRLYPYKFRDKMGVPPVDRVMLLCYNLLNPKDHSDKNTILDLHELEKYLQTKTKYPLPLDIGLPAYSSCYKFTNGQFDEVSHGVPEELEGICLESSDGLWFTVAKDTSFQSNYYKQGQRIKIERVSPKVLLDAARSILKNVSLDSEMTVTIYHLDQTELKQYNHETLDAVYQLFDKR